MAAERVRRWRVTPDQTIVTQQHGEIACVSREAMVEAIMDGEAFLARSGGILTVVTQRHPTDLAGEAVTTGAVVEWKAGASATVEHQQPPSPAPAAPAPPASTVVVPEPVDNSASQPDLEAAMRQQLATVAASPAPQVAGTGANGDVVVPQSPVSRDDIGDGLDHLEADEDLSEIPAEQR